MNQCKFKGLHFSACLGALVSLSLLMFGTAIQAQSKVDEPDGPTNVQRAQAAAGGAGSVRLYYDGVKTAAIRWTAYAVNPDIDPQTFVLTPSSFKE